MLVLLVPIDHVDRALFESRDGIHNNYELKRKKGFYKSYIEVSS